MRVNRKRQQVLCICTLTVFVIGYSSYRTKTATKTMIKWIRKLPTISDDPYIIETAELPGDPRFNPTIANGYLGHAVYSDTIHMNGLYNGEKGDSHRARISGTLPYIDIKTTVFLDEEKLPLDTAYMTKYTLDMWKGTYTQSFKIVDQKSQDTLCTVTETFFAHRFLTRVLVAQFSVSFIMNGTLIIALKSSSGDPSTDIKFRNAKEMYVRNEPVKISCGHTVTPEQPDLDVLSVCYVSTVFSTKRSVFSSSGKVVEFAYMTSISDTVQDAQKFFDMALKMQEKGTLCSVHEEEWRKTWKNGSILVVSDSKFYTSSFISGIYYLLSAFPPPSISTYPYHFFGASPGGLTNGGKGQDYWGHVFWDQDFWMLPALLPLFPEAVKHGLQYRIARLEMAKLKAKKLGFKGAMYPWESAYSGNDVCPGDSYIIYEQHVTGDLIHTLKQYVYATGNWKFLLEKTLAFPVTSDIRFNSGWNLTYETAKFWFSRAIWDKDRKRYVINDVMGPDEYHAPVDNSAFTNAVASQNLKFAVEAADVLNIKLPEKDDFQKVADNILIPYDKILDYHPEFDGYDPKNDTVKQADAIMLGFPLMNKLSTSSREHDLEIYGNTTDPRGPAMTWSMFAINLNDVGHRSAADKYFLRQHGNIQPPFQIWSEEPDGGGAVNFLTGIGGYLQSALYGYLNLRIYQTHFSVAPRLLPPLEGKPVKEMLISGLKFQGVIFDIKISEITYFVTLAGFTGKDKFSVVLKSSAGDHVLSKVGDSISYPANITCSISIKRWS